MNTEVDKLLSGVEFEVKELTGKHQRLLTEQNSKSFTEKMNNLLADVLVRVGTNKHIDVEFVERMLAGDRAKVLTTVRQFSMDYEKVFSFDWEYVSQDGSTKTHKLEIPLEKGVFPDRPYKLRNEAGEWVTMESYILEQKGWTEPEPGEEREDIEKPVIEYEDVLELRKVNMILPRSGQEIEYTMVDGLAEIAISKTKKDERSSHSALKMRNPVYFYGDKRTRMQLVLDNLALKDLESLRLDIREHEGSVDTEVRFEHPESEFKAPNEKDVVVELLGEIAFFFPSGAI